MQNFVHLAFYSYRTKLLTPSLCDSPSCTVYHQNPWCNPICAVLPASSRMLRSSPQLL